MKATRTTEYRYNSSGKLVELTAHNEATGWRPAIDEVADSRCGNLSKKFCMFPKTYSLTTLLLFLVATALLPLNCIAGEGGQRKSEGELVLIKNRGNTAQFSLRNTSARSMKLTTGYGVYLKGMPFEPDGVILEHRRDGKWKAFSYPIIGYRGVFTLKAKAKVVFDVDLELLASGLKLKKGAPIRIIVDGVYSNVFAYQGD